MSAQATPHRRARTIRSAILVLAVTVSIGACSFTTAFDGLTGGNVEPDGGATSDRDGGATLGGDGAANDASVTPPGPDGAPADAATAFCLTQPNAALCEDFDDGMPLGQSAAGWGTVNGMAQLSLVPTSFSSPNAMQLEIPFAADTESNADYTLTRNFNGPIGTLTCRWMMARDNLVGVGHVILGRFKIDVDAYSHFDVRIQATSPTVVDVGVRGINPGLALDAYVKSPVVLPNTDYIPFELTAKFSGTPTATLKAGLQSPASVAFSSTFPINAPPTLARFQLGHTYSYAAFNAPATGTWRIRYDDIACTMGP